MPLPISTPTIPILLLLLISIILHFQPTLTNKNNNNNNKNTLKLQLTFIQHSTSPSQTLLLDNHRVASLHRRLRSPLTSGAVSGSGQYFAQISLGSPPQTLSLVADTGSDLTWVTCSACRTQDCSLRHPTGSAFFPRHSATFAPSHCFDAACELVPHPSHSHCNRTTRLHTPCLYEYTYGDGSLTTGIFSQETTSLNSTSGDVVRVDGVRVGCGFHVSGPSLTGSSFEGASGVMGLGRGPISFSAQLGGLFGNRFSYCLKDYTLSPPLTSYLVIGGKPKHKSKHGLKRKRKNHLLHYTPLLTNVLSPTFYYIGINAVIINGRKLPINPSVWALDDLGNGGTIIDSGTTLTFMPDQAYRMIISAMSKRVELPRLTELTQGFDLCYNVSGVTRPSFPQMSLLFVGENDDDSVYDPPQGNYFIDVAPDVKCLGLQAVTSPSGFAVIGNLMQQGFFFEFDNDKSRLYFSRYGCNVDR